MASTVLSESSDSWRAAALAIAIGELVAFPTDTVYGVGCDLYNPDALERIYIAKGRPLEKAVPLLLSGADKLPLVASGMADAANKLAAHYWPGPLTLVVTRNADLPPQLGSRDTIAVRVPGYAGLREFIARCGGALAVTSANRSGEPDATTVEQAIRYLGDSVAIYIDGGQTQGSKPSTVVDCSGPIIRVLREGALSVEQIEMKLGEMGR